MVTIAIKTTGCKVNQADSAEIMEALKDLGVRFVELGEKAHIAVVNACTVTSRADRDARQAVYRALRTVRGRVFLTGCLAERISCMEGWGDRVFVVRGTWDRHELIQCLRQEVRTLESEGSGVMESVEDQSTAEFEMQRCFERTRPIIKVQDGCDRACSYCIVPKVRGRGRSVPMEVVLKKVQMAKERGASEVVIAGTDLGSWGKDLGRKVGLVDLLEMCLKFSGRMRIRLSSLEPDRICDALVDLLGSCEDLCPHLHISMQSGSCAVLKAMNRDVQCLSRVKDVVQKLRAKRFGFAIGMDIISGFPTERESDFVETFDFLRIVDPTYLHVFKFSRRPGTKAEMLTHVCSDVEVRERCRTLREFGLRQRERWAKEFLGKHVEVVDIRSLGDKYVEGLTGEYFSCVREGATKKGARLPAVVEAIEGRMLRVSTTEVYD